MDFLNHGVLTSKRWYVLRVNSGSERKLAASIRDQVERNGFSDRVQEILVPSENVVETRMGEKTSSEKSFFPGYILIRMDFDNEIWRLIQSISKTIKFLGSRGYPCPIPSSESSRLLKQVQEQDGRFRHRVVFEVGEQVRICDGPFMSFNGFVEEVDEEKERLKVCVSIFGRETPVTLGFEQIEKTCP